MTTVADQVKPFDLSTHNGFVTVSNPASGEHRTFKIYRKRENAKFCPGSRIVGLLIGSDNENDYQDFGFVTDDGRVILWKRYRESPSYQWFARCLSNPERFTHKVEFNFDARCLRCGKKLTTPESVLLGLGPECRSKGM